MFYKKIVFSVLCFMHHAAKPGTAPTAAQIFEHHISALALLSDILSNHQLPAIDIPYARVQQTVHEGLEPYVSKDVINIIGEYLRLNVNLREFSEQQEKEPDLWLSFRDQFFTPYVAACKAKQRITPFDFYGTMHTQGITPQSILTKIITTIQSRAGYNLANNPFQFTTQRTFQKPAQDNNHCSICDTEITPKTATFERNFLAIGEHATIAPYSFEQSIDESLENGAALITCPNRFCGAKNQFAVNERLITTPLILALETGQHFGTTTIPSSIKKLGNTTLPNEFSYNLIGLWFYKQQESHALIYDSKTWYKYGAYSIKELDKSHVRAILCSKKYPRPTMLFYRLTTNAPVAEALKK